MKSPQERSEHGRSDRRRAVGAAAIRLFSERGVEDTTVEDIASAAGVSVRTFFRYFNSKEAAAFPDHADRIAEIAALLSQRRDSLDPVQACLEVCRQVTLDFFKDPEIYRPRYRLLRSVPSLRDYERLIDIGYENALSEYLDSELDADGQERVVPRIIAAAVVAVVNHTLDTWALDDDVDPVECLDRGLGVISAKFGKPTGAGLTAVDAQHGDLIIVVPGTAELREAILNVISRATRA